MRKGKAIKQKKLKAVLEFKRGNKEEAYKLWREAAQERLVLQKKT